MSASEGQQELRERLRQLTVFAGDLPSFRPERAPSHPAELFADWLGEAIDAGVREPHAMTLSTVDADGRPSSRVLILKGLGDGRWEFATSSASRKGAELAGSGWAALGFYWSEQGRQVRVRGRVLPVGPERSAADFRERSAGARAEALAGTQSELLADERDLDAALSEARELVARDPDRIAADWTLYGLVADEVEFWQAHPERRHVRLRYRLRGGVWVRERLWP